jgi:hypothetical protein
VGEWVSEGGREWMRERREGVRERGMEETRRVFVSLGRWRGVRGGVFG